VDVALAAVEPELSVESLYRADGDRLWRALFAFTSDGEIASDAVAEAYAQLLRRGASVRNPQAWTWRAAFRIAAGTMKANGSTPSGSESRGVHVDRYVDSDLLTALAALPIAQRAAVVLFYYADLPVGQIASRVGSNSIAVRANLARGRRRLRQLLGERNG
jgi:RNA polymerase sigma-70 factor (ECF subfamily)